LSREVGLEDAQVKVLSGGGTIRSRGRSHAPNVFGSILKVLPLHDLWQLGFQSITCTSLNMDSNCQLYEVRDTEEHLLSENMKPETICFG